MSLYNMLFGKNPLSESILDVIGLKEEDCGRLRDVFVTEDEKIAVYTRNGASNRETEYIAEAIEKMRSNKYFISDSDDDFDCTYATFYFSIPEDFKPLAFLIRQSFSPDEMWHKKLEEIKNSNQEDLRSKYPVVCAAVEQIASFVGKNK